MNQWKKRKVNMEAAIKTYGLATLFIPVLLISCDGDSPLVSPLASGRYDYQAFDSAGRPVVTGWMFIENKDQSSIKGIWNLNAIASPEAIGPQTGSGELSGRLEGDEISLNLNPQFIDSNVYLIGSMEGDTFIGIWQWISYSGITNEGTFTASKS